MSARLAHSWSPLIRVRTCVRATECPPLTRLHRAIERGDLDLVRRTARECGALGLEDALHILLLIRDKGPETFERGGVRWAGRFLATCPELGFGGAQNAVRQIDALSGHERSVAASRLALALRGVGEIRTARVLEGGSGGG